ncbi:acyltransferase family protein [Lachnoclostridium sp. Marseille-P6806]|uniref:acyltransferase family protein n=1 Tax=Lachnoclostridium sp. Marseille-P6806 TaxID=2364793 RepID=UPI0013EF2590|nr:acyltransferase [Lachnoclostridium sp. Marseille-P6806]
MINTKEKIDGLTGGRFFAILVIVISHFNFFSGIRGGEIYTQYLNNAVPGVDYFFILSGFGMMRSYLRDGRRVEAARGIKGGLRYAAAHVRKIYPLYLVTMLLCIPAAFRDLYFEHGETLAGSALHMLLWAVSAVPMLQSATAVSEFSTSFNSVAWFLSSLFVIYMFSPFLLRLLKRMLSTKRRIMAALFVLPVAASGAGWLFHQIEMRTFFDKLSYASPYWRVFYVVFGMVLALLAAEDRGFRMGAVAGNAAAVLSVVWFLMRNRVYTILYSRTYIIDLLLGGLLFCGIAAGAGVLRLFQRKSIVRLGELSMYVFLIHYPLVLYLTWYRRITGLYEALFAAALILGVTYAVSYGLWKVQR